MNISVLTAAASYQTGGDELTLKFASILAGVVLAGLFLGGQILFRESGLTTKKKRRW